MRRGRPVSAAAFAAAALAVVAVAVLGGRGDAAGVSVADRVGGPCPAIPRAAYRPAPPEIHKERLPCQLSARAEDVQMWALSPLGDVRFAHGCYVTFDLRLDSRGGALIRRYSVGGPQPCVDSRACFGSKGFDPLGWRGALEPHDRPGSYRLAMDACLETCMGRFAGRLELELVRRAGARWEVHARDATIGSSGWRYATGTWRLAGAARISVRPA